MCECFTDTQNKKTLRIHDALGGGRAYWTCYEIATTVVWTLRGILVFYISIVLGITMIHNYVYNIIVS